MLASGWSINLRQQDRLRSVALEAQQAQLKMLRFQINPHLLFNVLSSIDTSILSNDLAASRRMLRKISDYLRETLNNDANESHSISDELKLLLLYIDIEQERFGKRLTYDYPKDIPHANIEIPRHLLQPLIENAIKHGISKLPSGGHIKITVETKNEYFVISIENPKPKIKNASLGFKLGVQNVQQRLETFFKGNAHIDIQESVDIFRVNIQLPIEYHAS